MRIDCHQHFWIHNEAEFGWISDEMAVLRRDFLPPDALPAMEAAGIGGSIAVQAPQSLAENDFLLGLQAANPTLIGVVGYMDVASSDLAAQINRYGAQLCGVRDNLQGTPQGFMTSQGFLDGLTLLGRHGLPFDIVVQEPQLAEVVQMVRQCPDTTFVLDHIGKPRIKEGMIEPWRSHILALAELDNVWCKLSGIAFEGDWAHWSAESLAPWIGIVLEAFGAERCLFGSDWPVSLCAGAYERHARLIEEFLGDDEQELVFEKNPYQAYRLR